MGAHQSNRHDADAYPVRIHAYRNEDQWAWAVAVSVSSTLRRDLHERPRARLLVSGGRTPVPVLEALSQAPLDWARVDVALVDERWLRPDDPDSTAFLVRRHLIRNHAAPARFETLTRLGRSIEAAVADANEHARRPADVVVLGMGVDGHTAALFPGMQGLDAALDSRQAYVAVNAAGCAGAGPWPRRISLTPAGLRPARSRLLLVRGDEKRAVLERAMAEGDAGELPVRIAFATPGATLHVHWCP